MTPNLRAFPLLFLGVLACGSPAPEAPSDPPVSVGAGGGGGAGGGESCPASREEPIQLDTNTGTLAGTAALPAGCGPFPVVLLLAGSGPTDRDGNGAGGTTTSDCLKLLAAALAERGIASVRYDKRGIAASAAAGPAREDDFTFTMYVDDAAAWVSSLRGDDRFRGLLIAGHSEGSLVGMVAAQRAPIEGFISIAGAGRPADEVLREQLSKRLTGPLLARAEEILAELTAGNRVSEVPPELAALFRPSVQPYLISWFKFDPAQEIRRVGAAALVIQGTTDIQVSEEDARLLSAGNPAVELRILDGMNHVLKEATLSASSQNAAYKDPSLPLFPDLAPAIAGFVAAHAR